MHSIRIKLGYWEAKDTDANLDEEIAKKRAIGGPVSNIIFEDTQTAVLFQHGREAMRVAMDNEEDLTHRPKVLTKDGHPRSTRKLSEHAWHLAMHLQTLPRL